MTIKLRTLVILASKGLSQSANILLGIIIVRLMSQADFGTYRQALLVYTSLGTILYLQLDAGLFYFVPKTREKRLAGFLLQTYLLTFASGAVIACVMYFGAPYIAAGMKNPELVPLIRVLSIYPFGERLLLLVPAYMISLDRAVRAGVYTIVGTLFRLVTVVMIIYLGGSLVQVFSWIVGGIGVLALLGAADMMWAARGTSFSMGRRDLSEQLAYCFPLLLSSIVAAVNMQFDKFLISAYFDVEKFAVYACGAMELPVIALVTYSLANAIMPNLVELAQKDRKAEMLVLWQKAMRKGALVIFPCFVFFFIVGRDFMSLLYGHQYADASWPFRVYLLALPVRIAVYGALLRAVGATRAIAVSAILGLITNVLASLSLTLLGQGSLLSFYGPALGTVLANLVIVYYSLIVIRRQVNQPISKVIMLPQNARLFLLFGLAAFPLPFMGLDGVPLMVSLGVKGVVYGMMCLAVLHLTNTLQEDERDILRLPIQLLQRLRQGRDK